MLCGCSSDLDVIKKDAINSEQLITVHKNFEFVKLNKTISKIITTSEKAKLSTINSKIVQTKDFKIFTNRVTYTTLKNKLRESYSFYIERNNSLKSNIVENLILAKNATNDNYRAYIATYFFPDGINSNHKNFKVITFQEINSQTLSIKNIFAKSACQDSYTYTIVETGHKCYSGEHYGAGEAGNCDGKGGLPYSTYSIQVLIVSCDTGAGGTYNPDPTFGTGTTGPTSPNTGNTLPVDTGMTFPTPCQTDDCSEMLIVNEINDLLDNSLDYFQLEWLAMNNDAANNIKSLLVQNNTSEAKAFAMNIINTLMNDGEVDFTYKVIVDQSLKDNSNLYGVYLQLGKAPVFQTYLQKFDSKFSIANLKLSVDNQFGINFPINQKAQAITLTPENYLINIILNNDANLPSNIMKFPKIVSAIIFVHEMMHAEINRILLTCSKLPNVNTQNMTDNQWAIYLKNIQNDFPKLYKYYEQYQLNTKTPTEYQHEYMAERYRNVIKLALKQYDSNTHSEEFYNTLSWFGLKDTSAWTNLSQAQRDQINNSLQKIYQDEPYFN